MLFAFREWCAGSMSRNPSQAEIYRRHAAQCIAVAQTCPDTSGKLTLLEMARAWPLLAEQASKTDETTPVSEAPAQELRAD